MREQPNIQQYYPVVLEVGSRFIKAGFAGDAAPISTIDINDPVINYQILPPETNLESSNSLPQSLLEQVYLTFEDSEPPSQELLEYYKVDLFHRHWLFNYDVFLDKNLRNPARNITENFLEKILSHIYLTDLLVDAKRCKVIIPCSVLWPQHIKRSIANVLLSSIHAQSLIFMPDSILSVISAGSMSGLVVDFDWEHVSVSPVYDQKLIYKSIKMTNRGSGKSLHYALLNQLLNHNEQNNNVREKLFPTKEAAFQLIEEMVHDVLYCREAGPADVSDGSFKFKSSNQVSIEFPSMLRHSVIENIFFPSDIMDPDNDEVPIIPLITDLIKELPIDIRSKLSLKIIFTGPLSHIPGLKARMLHELRKHHNRKQPSVEAIISLGSWAGASLYCSTRLMASSNIIKNHELVRDKYLQENAKIPDWIEQIYTL